MRTTIAIDDHLLALAKTRAHALRWTLGQLVEKALQHELARGKSVEARPPIPVFSAGTGPRPGIDVTSNRGMLEALDEGQSLDRLR